MSICVGTSAGLFNFNGIFNHQLKAQEIRCIQEDPEGSYWAISDRRSIIKKTPDTGWEKVEDIPEGEALCLLPLKDQLLVGTSQPSLFSLKEKKFNKITGFEKVPGRENWSNPAGDNPHVRSFAAGNDGEIFINIHVGGILKTTGSFKEFSPTIDVDADAHQVLYDEDTGWLYAATARGVGVSKNKGKNWDFIDQGLHAPYCRAVANTENNIFISASTGPSTEDSKIYRMDKRSLKKAEPGMAGLPQKFQGNINTYCLYARGQDVIFASASGELFYSNNEANDWKMISRELGHCFSVYFI